MQQALNLSVFKLREDLVYENANINIFACSRLHQKQNFEYFSRRDKQNLLNVEKVAHMFKYFGAGENRPVNGTPFGLVPQDKEGKILMPEYFN